MSVAWSTFWQNFTLVLIAIAILFTYYKASLKPRMEARRRKNIGGINKKIREHMDKLEKKGRQTKQQNN